MLSFKSLQGTKSVLVHLLECQLRYAFCRAISSTQPCSKYPIYPSFRDPEKDVEYSEPGCSERDSDDSFIYIPTRKQLKEQVKFLKDEFKVWKKERKDELETNYDWLIPQGN